VWGREGGAGREVFEGGGDCFGENALVGFEFEGLRVVRYGWGGCMGGMGESVRLRWGLFRSV
jgi:hypothetical protein